MKLIKRNFCSRFAGRFGTKSTEVDLKTYVVFTVLLGLFVFSFVGLGGPPTSSPGADTPPYRQYCMHRPGITIDHCLLSDDDCYCYA